jgi:hypothetical protein
MLHVHFILHIAYTFHITCYMYISYDVPLNFPGPVPPIPAAPLANCLPAGGCVGCQNFIYVLFYDVLKCGGRPCDNVRLCVCLCVCVCTCVCVCVCACVCVCVCVCILTCTHTLSHYITNVCVCACACVGVCDYITNIRQATSCRRLQQHAALSMLTVFSVLIYNTTQYSI